MFQTEVKAGLITFTHDGKQYTMTAEQIEAAYRYQQRQYRLEDAKRQLNTLIFGCDDGSDFDRPEEGEKEKEWFQSEYCITYAEAADDEMLEEFTRRFENRLDCNLDENGQWEAAVKAVLIDRIEAERRMM